MIVSSRLSIQFVRLALIVLVATLCQRLVSHAPLRGQTIGGAVKSSGELPSGADALDSSRSAAQGTSDRPSKATDIGRAIEELAAPKFQRRQRAQAELIRAGSVAVEALEQAAKQPQLEAATRCVAVLVQIARDKEQGTTALAALKRLAADRTHRIAEHAAKALDALTTTNEDRAIAALSEEGARIQFDQRGAVRSVSNITRYVQIAHLLHFPRLRSVRLTGNQITDDGL